MLGQHPNARVASICPASTRLLTLVSLHALGKPCFLNTPRMMTNMQHHVSRWGGSVLAVAVHARCSMNQRKISMLQNHVSRLLLTWFWEHARSTKNMLQKHVSRLTLVWAQAISCVHTRDLLWERASDLLCEHTRDLLCGLVPGDSNPNSQLFLSLVDSNSNL